MEKWVKQGKVVDEQFPDQCQYFIDKILTNYKITSELYNDVLRNI